MSASAHSMFLGGLQISLTRGFVKASSDLAHSTVASRRCRCVYQVGRVGSGKGDAYG